LFANDGFTQNLKSGPSASSGIAGRE